MAVKKIRSKVIALLLGALLPIIAWSGLETGTYISDLVSTNPLGSDLASTLDDHIRLLKSTIKTTFPNINGAVTVTDEVLNSVPTGSGNPSASIGLSAVNGSATTYMRSDGAPALSQSIAPTWTAQHIFSSAYAGAGSSAGLLSSNFPMLEWNDANSDTDDRLWQMYANTDQFVLRAITDNRSTASSIAMQVDRTNGTVDSVVFPAGTGPAGAFIVGATSSLLSFRTSQFTSSAGNVPLLSKSDSLTSEAITTWNSLAVGNNLLVTFGTDTAFTTRGTIDYDRTGGVIRYNTTSDERLKKNFAPAPSARDVISCIQIESYDWKESGNHVTHGLVAQHLERCAPYAVSSSKDPKQIWGVDPSKLVPALIKYVQEQDARIARLEADAARRH